MKRIISFVLILTMLVCVIPICGNAAENQKETIYFDDGSYMTIGINTIRTRAAGSVSGSKPYTYYGSDGEARWEATLTGSFTYTGSKATCTSSSVDVTIYNSAWYTISKSASKSGNTATASVTMGEKRGGVTVTNFPINLSLSCDKDGNLS